MITRLPLAAMVLALLPTSVMPTLAMAQKAAGAALLKGADPQAILDIVKGFGSSELGKDAKGDPRITGRMEGTKYTLVFYGCKANVDCKAVQFIAAWQLKDKLPLERMNIYNNERRFGKALLDKDGDPRVELDVNLAGGVTRANFEDTVDWWKATLVQFSKFLDASKPDGGKADAGKPDIVKSEVAPLLTPPVVAPTVAPVAAAPVAPRVAKSDAAKSEAAKSEAAKPADEPATAVSQPRESPTTEAKAGETQSSEPAVVKKDASE